MTMLIIQSLLLMAIAYIVGCILGGLLRYLFAAENEVGTPAPAPLASPAPAPKPDPKPVKPKPAPKPEPAPKPVPKPASVQKDDLKRIRGIGPQNEARLNAAGVQAFSQIAGWSAKDQREMGVRLAFPGRIEREDWVKQAKILAKGGTTQFAKRVDKGEVSSSVGKASVGDLGKKPSVMSSAPADGGDDLTLIGGVGGALEKKLIAMGIYSFEQISKWDKDQQTWVSNELGFPGRVERENWVAEAKVLAKGGTTEHSKKAERGEIRTSRKS